MLFNSLHFLLFFPIVLGVFHLIPHKAKHVWLLICSYYFYMSWNVKYSLLLLLSTIVTYLCALVFDHINSLNKKAAHASFWKKATVILGIVLNLSVLFFFKYFNFAMYTVNYAAGLLQLEIHTPTWNVLLPVGISFYTFQAVGYMIDVYRGDIKATRNFIQYALFVSFFPQLVAGPIERSGNLLSQLKEMKRPSYYKVRHGFLVMLWGFFLKMVIADRIAVFVDTVYGDPATFPGVFVAVATILFAFQIYCDFAGYSVIATGAAEMLGIDLMQNFNTPYLSTSVKEFWRRWHISLNTWFKDYLYIPLGGSRCGKIKQYCNTLIVFLTSGLWHGAGWTFVLWGLLNGLYQILGDILMPCLRWVDKILGQKDQLCRKIISTTVTFLLVDFAWLFFRASNIRTAVAMARSVFTEHNLWVLFDGSLYNCGLTNKEFGIMLLGIGILLFADYCNYRGNRLSDTIERQSLWFRWTVYLSAILAIVIFGIWGSKYNAGSFIYFQF